MLQVTKHSPRRLPPNHEVVNEHGQRTSSPRSFSPSGLYPVGPAVGQGFHSSPPSNSTQQQPSFAIPRNMDSSMDRISDLSPSQLSEMMHSGRPWWAKDLGMGKDPSGASHQRESSLTSTLGSTGPNSPCSPNIPTPHIALNDSVDDTFRDSQGSGAWNYHFASDPTPIQQDQFLYTGPQVYGLQINGQSGKQAYATDSLGGGRATEPPPGMDAPYSPRVLQSIPMTSSASAPMANSVQEFRDNSSGLPSGGESFEGSRQRDGKISTSLWAPLHSSLQVDNSTAIPDVPKLDRTMTDIYNDNLYNPNLDIISSASPSAAPSSPGDDIFSQRLSAAGSLGGVPQHQGLAGAQLPVTASYHAAPTAAHETQLFRDANDPHTPQTISPQESMLDFSEPDAGSSNFPLFPRPEPNSFGAMDAMNQGGFPQGHYQSGAGGHNLSYIPEASPALFGSQDFPMFGARQDARSSSAMHPSEDASTEWVGHGQRPTENNDSGTYSCTYHGCSQRFETPTLLQKHKREGHRQANSLKSIPRGGKGGVMDTQAGPHRCQRINPGTGKVCKAVFSRPYDLTRHEDTIHNARKQKVRCDLCTEEKLFSRADALTRHYRVCHPDVELPGKHKRRRPGGQS